MTPGFGFAMAEPSQKRQKVSSRSEQQDNDKEIGAIGAYDVVSTHRGREEVHKFTVTTIHDLLLGPQELGKYYILNLVNAREYMVEALKRHGTEGISGGMEAMYTNLCEQMGCKVLSATKMLGECRGYDVLQVSQGGTTVEQKHPNPQAELEWGTDTGGAFTHSSFKENEQFDYLKKDGGLPVVNLESIMENTSGDKLTLTDAVTAQCFNDRGVIQGPDHKAWTVQPMKERWLSWNLKSHVVFPYYQKSYIPTDPEDDVPPPRQRRDFDVTAVYLRVKQLDPAIKTYIRCLMTTKMTMLVRFWMPHVCRRTLAFSLCKMQSPERWTDGVDVWVKNVHMYSVAE